MKKTLIGIFILFNIMSCSKDEFNYKTDGQLIGEEILKLTNEQGVSYASSYVRKVSNDGEYILQDQSQKLFTINGPVIQLEGQYYNLNSLESYEIITELKYPTETEIKVLILYFDSKPY